MSYTPQRVLPNGLHTRPYGSTRKEGSMTRDGRESTLGAGASAADPEEREEDPVHRTLKNRWVESDASISALFGNDGRHSRRGSKRPAPTSIEDLSSSVNGAKTGPPPKKVARIIDEDDYGDDDDDEEDDAAKDSPLKGKSKAHLPNGIIPGPLRSPIPSNQLLPGAGPTSTPTEPAKSSEDVRKQLDEDKKAADEAAKKTFQSMFFTLEHDRDAMLEQKKLDDLDREVENEVSGPNGTQSAQQGSSGGSGAAGIQGSLGSADLGASSLTLKHLIARIDMKRDLVKASDGQLRNLISEVRKGRSKWASEDRVGQEELYEAAEKVLMELKAMTDYAQPFLQKVNKRDAPDYFTIIKHPMDIGTMLKKLKQLQYKSKKDFVDDLSLIWTNCLKYNQDPQHLLRRKALHMQKQTDKLVPLIPEIVVRDRAEVEAEERRMHAADAEDSDDDDAPIMASRGRKAPKKGGKSGPTSTKRGPTVAVEESSSTPAPEAKPVMHPAAAHLRNEFLRADSELHDASSTGFNTPPPGNATPMGINGVHGTGAPGSQADGTEMDGIGQSVLSAEEEDEDDTEFKTWKQVTKRDRAQAAAERNRLFRGEAGKHLNPEEPALLRSKAMMRRWLRQQKMVPSSKAARDYDAQEGDDGAEQTAQSETLAEGIEKDQDSTLPDYYEPLSAIPDVDDRWRWTTDSEGFVVPQNDEWMRRYPQEQFKSSTSNLTKRMEANMRQMQETRKVCAKIGIVKQMQIQAQTYQNQFSKYEPQPFVEQDPGPVIVSDDGPPMAPWVCRAALQRSVGKIFYHAGFEDFQPSALESVTDLASEYFTKLVEGFKNFREQPRQESSQSHFTFEEQVLHSLHEHGLDLESLETHVKDDVDRLSTKLGVVHERMKSHLADLLRPALGDHAGADGAGAFNDGSEQFVGGDFAEDLDEDFFGFRELGLAEEYGLETLSVPLHLLQNRMHSAYQAQNQGPTTNTGFVFPPPAPFEAVTADTAPNQVGLIKDYFLAKLRNNHTNETLIEDEDLPQKQRFPKPRLPPTGKISSPRKRPIREQQQAAKKKRKLEESGEKSKGIQPPVGKLRLEMPELPKENGVEPEKDGDGGGGLVSPESITAN